MGGGSSKQTPALSAEERRRQEAVNQRADKLSQADAKVIKVLLLGAGECGKSTILKQMKILHLDGFEKGEIENYKHLILKNVLESIQTLCRAMDELEDPKPKYESSKAEEYGAKMLLLSEDYDLVAEDRPKINKVWADAGIQAVCLRNREFHLLDSAPYFLAEENLERILDNDYVPGEADILRCRLATTGIHQTKFAMNNLNFRMFDVGGQRGERKKWIHCFENVTAIMYIASLTEYDQVLAEDRTRNRFEESLALFTGIINLPWFKSASIILFLNKSDLFEEKVKRVPIGQYFPEYNYSEFKKGEDEYEDGCNYIRGKYMEKNTDSDKSVYVHITNATNTDNIRFVWKAVRHMILQKNLHQSGLSCGF